MGLLDDAKAKAEELLHGNKDKAGDAVDKGGDFVDGKTDGKYADKVDQGQDAAKDFINKSE